MVVSFSLSITITKIVYITSFRKNILYYSEHRVNSLDHFVQRITDNLEEKEKWISY
jgi:hypothetical protein